MEITTAYKRAMNHILVIVNFSIENKTLTPEERRRLFELKEFIQTVMSANKVNHELLTECTRLHFTKK